MYLIIQNLEVKIYVV